MRGLQDIIHGGRLKEVGFSLETTGEVPKFSYWRSHPKDKSNNLLSGIRWEGRKSVYNKMEVQCKAAAPMGVGSPKGLGARLECAPSQAPDQAVGPLGNGLTLRVVGMPGSCCLEVPVRSVHGTCSAHTPEELPPRSVGRIQCGEEALPRRFCIIRKL